MKDEIVTFADLLKAREILKRIQQLSWNVSAMEKRYPPTEAMTSEELESMYKFYLVSYFDLKDAVKSLKKLYKKYKNDKK
jgi:hypothetical protein